MSRKSKTVLSILVILMLSVAYIGYRKLTRYDSLVSAIRAKGEPVTPEDLDAYYPSVPDARNSALLIVQAADALHDPPVHSMVPLFTEHPMPISGVALTDGESGDIALMLRLNSYSLELMEKADTFSESHFELPKWPFHDQMPYLQSVRNLARLSAIESIYRADNGDTQGAVESVRRGIAVAESLKNIPLLVPQIVRQNARSYPMNATEYLVNRCGLSNDELAALLKCFQACEGPAALHRALAGERCLVLSSGISIATFAKIGAPVRNTSRFAWSFAGGPYDSKCQLQNFAALIAAVQLPERPRRLEIERLKRNNGSAAIPELTAIVSPTAMPAMEACLRATDALDCGTARLRVLCSAIAALQFQKANGRFPVSPDDFVPEYLPTPPIDPFDGNRIRSITNDTDFVTYSIGVNLVDEDGRRANSPLQGDLTFSVKR